MDGSSVMLSFHSGGCGKVTAAATFNGRERDRHHGATGCGGTDFSFRLAHNDYLGPYTAVLIVDFYISQGVRDIIGTRTIGRDVPLVDVRSLSGRDTLVLQPFEDNFVITVGEMRSDTVCLGKSSIRVVGCFTFNNSGSVFGFRVGIRERKGWRSRSCAFGCMPITVTAQDGWNSWG